MGFGTLGTNGQDLMNRIFKPKGYFRVPDGTDVSPFLNATDENQQDVPWGVLGELSIAAGRIGAGVSSAVHVHPVVVHVTYLVSGRLEVQMRDALGGKPYSLNLEPGNAVVTEPGTLFQLRNTTDTTAEVLYIVSPPYVFEKLDGSIVYDDAIFVAETWDELV